MNKGTPADPLRERLSAYLADAIEYKREWVPISLQTLREIIAALATKPAADDSQRCIDARNRLWAVLDAPGSVIGSLEEAVHVACLRLATKPAETPDLDKLIKEVTDIDGDFLRYECVHPTESAGKSPTSPSVQPPAPEPVAWMWQHAETGMTGFVEHASPEDLAHFERMNKPRKIVCPLYATPSIAQRGAPEPRCVCGQPLTLGVVHRLDGPCWIPDDPAQRGAALTARADLLLAIADYGGTPFGGGAVQAHERVIEKLNAYVAALSPERPE